MYLWRRLDYASPEILRGEFYSGKEQDAWAHAPLQTCSLWANTFFLGRW